MQNRSKCSFKNIFSTIFQIFFVRFPVETKSFTWSNAIGNWGWTSVVIHILNVLCMSSESDKASMASVQNGRDKCMFCRRTQPPFAMQSDIMFLACISWPWPMDTERISERKANQQTLTSKTYKRSRGAMHYECLWSWPGQWFVVMGPNRWIEYKQGAFEVPILPKFFPNPRCTLLHTPAPTNL